MLGIFRRPRKYDDDFQIEHFTKTLSGLTDTFIIPIEYNLEVISLTIRVRATAGIHPATCVVRPYFYDANYKMFIAPGMTLKDGQTVECTWQTGYFLTASATPILNFTQQLPTNIFLVPGNRVVIVIEDGIAGDDLKTFSMYAKRWKL